METEITSKDKLEQAIRCLEMKREEDALELKHHFNETYQDLKPVNIIKNTLTDIEHSPEVKSEMIKAAIGLAASFLVKKLIAARTSNPLLATIGSVVPLGISALMARYPDFFKRIAVSFLRILFKNRLQQPQLSLPEHIAR